MWNGRTEVVAHLGGGPNGAAIGPDGAVYVCNNGGFEWRQWNNLLAPAGTSAEDLRELAMKQAPGDIVTLLSGCLMPDLAMGEREILKTS